MIKELSMDNSRTSKPLTFERNYSSSSIRLTKQDPDI